MYTLLTDPVGQMLIRITFVAPELPTVSPQLLRHAGSSQWPLHLQSMDASYKCGWVTPLSPAIDNSTERVILEQQKSYSKQFNEERNRNGLLETMLN